MQRAGGIDWSSCLSPAASPQPSSATVPHRGNRRTCSKLGTKGRHFPRCKVQPLVRPLRPHHPPLHRITAATRRTRHLIRPWIVDRPMATPVSLPDGPAERPQLSPLSYPAHAQYTEGEESQAACACGPTS